MRRRFHAIVEMLVLHTGEHISTDHTTRREKRSRGNSFGKSAIIYNLGKSDHRKYYFDSNFDFKITLRLYISWM